jgi:hypothetical protein
MTDIPEKMFQNVSKPEEERLTYQCPCCKFKTLRGRAADEICPICFWHDDGQDEHDADLVRGGPNHTLSLRQAQLNFKRMGAIEDRFCKNVRQPRPDEL